jgi:hypothetical protein
LKISYLSFDKIFWGKITTSKTENKLMKDKVGSQPMSEKAPQHMRTAMGKYRRKEWQNNQ